MGITVLDDFPELKALTNCRVVSMQILYSQSSAQPRKWDFCNEAVAEFLKIIQKCPYLLYIFVMIFLPSRLVKRVKNHIIKHNSNILKVKNRKTARTPSIKIACEGDLTLKKL